MKKRPEKSSNIPTVYEPTFKACIPDHLLDKIKDDTSRWMLEEVSKMQQNNQWQNKKIHDIYEYTRTINGQVVSLLEFRKDLLVQMEAEHKLDKVKQETKTHTTKLYKIIALCFLTVVYPLFLTQWTTGGVSKILNFLW